MRDYDATVKNLREAAKGLLFDAMPYRASVMEDAADAIEELLVELTTIRKQLPRWISVEERLPKVNQSVLFCAFGRTVGEGTYRGYDGFHHVWKMYAVAGTYWDDEVTHWMPLPEPPKGVE